MLKPLIPSEDPLLHNKIKKCSYNLDRSKLSYTLNENMFHHNGVGLSANQIGIEERVFVMMIDIDGYIPFTFPRDPYGSLFLCYNIGVERKGTVCR